MTDLWPWLVVAGLGAFHGINPAMGWLFAVALGLHRASGRVVALALLPIAAGHLLAIAAVAAAFLLLGLVLELRWLGRAGGLSLIGWAFWHWRWGSRHRVRFGMTVGWLGLVAWSFLMATAHGAGLMLIPALVPICFGGDTLALGGRFADSMALSALAVLLHTAAMLAVQGTVAYLVYRFIGLAILRRAWINLDLLWTVALFLAGAVLLLTPG